MKKIINTMWHNFTDDLITTFVGIFFVLIAIVLCASETLPWVTMSIAVPVGFLIGCLNFKTKYEIDETIVEDEETTSEVNA